MSFASPATGRRRLGLIAPAGLAALALVLGACGGDEDGDGGDGTSTTTPTATETVEATASPTATTTAPPTATASPTETATEAPGEPSAEDAVESLEAYFASIEAGDYQVAYDLWADDGEASGQTFEEFAAGFGDTESITVEIGEPGRVEPAAGSRFVEIPVEITSTLASGEEERFEGAYVFRRGVVEGAATEWRIYSADVTEVS